MNPKLETRNPNPRRHWTRFYGRTFTTLDKVLAVAIVLVLVLGLILGRSQNPPLPPGAEPALTNTVTIAWDRNPASDYYLAVDTNGIPVPLLYRVRQSHSITNPLPWPVVAETTNTTAVISNLTLRTHFWYVTASNFFLESAPSQFLSLPFEPPTHLRIHIP
jgi:hypothetical protein